MLICSKGTAYCECPVVNGEREYIVVGLVVEILDVIFFFFFFKQKTAYEMIW